MAIAIAIAILGVSRLITHRFQVLVCIGFILLVLAGLNLSISNGFHSSGYYTSEVALAQEEKTIGELLLTRHAPQFYIYDVTTLGSIMYYSRLVTPVFISTSIPSGAYVLYQTNELQKLETAFPQMRLASLYQASSLSLAKSE